MEEVLEFCGFTTAFDMIKYHFTQEQLMDLLCELLCENDELITEICEEIAYDNYGWRDLEAIKADAEDIAYQSFKDERI
tara:strand:+ start:103 stop:339 length:237 start_codon:yes stop_codon:yes gene_type:complete